jgi:hypothetical protein
VADYLTGLDKSCGHNHQCNDYRYDAYFSCENNIMINLQMLLALLVETVSVHYMFPSPRSTHGDHCAAVDPIL